MHKSTKNGDTEIGILKVVFCGDKSCLYFSYNNFEGIKRVVLVEISLSLENANILLSIAGLLSQKGKDVSEELPEDFVKYIGNLRRIFESLLPTKPRFQRSEREKYTPYKRYIMSYPKISMLSGEGALMTDFCIFANQ